MPASRPPLCQPVHGTSFELNSLASRLCIDKKSQKATWFSSVFVSHAGVGYWEVLFVFCCFSLSRLWKGVAVEMKHPQKLETSDGCR